MNWSNNIATSLPASLKSSLDEIQQHAPVDFTANVAGHFDPADLQKILDRAQDRLQELIQKTPPRSHAELALLWNQVVTDFYENDQWGFTTKPSPTLRVKEKKPNQKLVGYLRTFLVPTLILKASILYFGLNFSRYPDEGYGWGLIAAIVLSLFNFALFLWKTRNDTDEDL